MRSNEFSTRLDEETKKEETVKDCSISCDLDFSLPNDVSVDVKNTFVNRRAEKEAVSLTVNLVDPFLELATDPNAADEDKRTKSPYEETPVRK